MNKKVARLRRARRTRLKIAELKVYRLSVHRTNKHIYAQIFSQCGEKVLVSASTLEVEVRQQLAANDAKSDAKKEQKNSGQGGNVAAAALIGKRIAEKAKAAGIERAAFDRSGFQYHGRVEQLANAAREAGLAL